MHAAAGNLDINNKNDCLPAISQHNSLFRSNGTTGYCGKWFNFSIIS